MLIKRHNMSFYGSNTLRCDKILKLVIIKFFKKYAFISFHDMGMLK